MSGRHTCHLGIAGWREVPSSYGVTSPKGIFCDKQFNTAHGPLVSRPLHCLDFTVCALGGWVGRWIRRQGNHHGPPKFLFSCTVIIFPLPLLSNHSLFSFMPLCSLEQNHLANQVVRSPKVERRMRAQDFSLILENLPLTSRLNWALTGLHVLGACTWRLCSALLGSPTRPWEVLRLAHTWK